MDQRPFATHNSAAGYKPRIRARSLLVAAIFLLLFGYYVYTPAASWGQNGPSPVYKHKWTPRYWPGWSGLNHIIFFGDSYTSTRFLPKNAPPSFENPFGNPPIPGNVSQKRPLWSDFAVMKYNKSQLTAINLSWGGATIDDELLVPFMDVIEGLNRQVAGHWTDKYSGGGSDAVNFHWQSHDTLITFWFGINDIIRAFQWENRTEVWKKDLTTYRESIEKVYHGGGRNFLFFNVPPIERAPLTVALGEDLQKKKAIQVAEWNQELFNMVHDFTKRHNDTTTFWWDTYKSYTEVFENKCSHEQTCVLKDMTGYCVECELWA
ncbi:hypothetical protein PRZ48_003088 [Zasmidium cellare]|uniref:Uncharacterized protein n=1 Tax=Zasmidium cellare TaxID=395010 RepID=A0ABR0EVK2_ZASCE|nr:hypothetical protein PRZ48_003088 [Zasmidium cellare]